LAELVFRFTQTDIHDLSPALLDAILSKIEGAGSAEKVAENDHLMKCMPCFALPAPYQFANDVFSGAFFSRTKRRDEGYRYGSADSDTRL
jgi:hypothetical protein